MNKHQMASRSATAICLTEMHERIADGLRQLETGHWVDGDEAGARIRRKINECRQAARKSVKRRANG
jgi:hypothetical protein